MKFRWSRREFLRTTTAAMLLGAAEKTLGATTPKVALLPKRRLGKTGEMVSVIGFGLGSRFCSFQDEDAAQALLERAFDLGINCFDTAGSYTRRPLERLSEKRLGEFSKKRRKDVFLATKIDPRDRDGALRSVETSLKFLQTDYLDLIQIHSLSDVNDLDRKFWELRKFPRFHANNFEYRQRQRGSCCHATTERPTNLALYWHHRT